MTTPSVLPAGYAGNAADFTKTKGVDRSGAVRLVKGLVSVPNGTAVNAIIGMIPFNKGARFHLDSSSFYAGNFGAGTTTLNIGYVYDDNVIYTDDPDAFVTLATAAQAGGFVTLDEKASLTFEAAANGWLVAQIAGAAADATADLEFNVLQSYAG